MSTVVPLWRYSGCGGKFINHFFLKRTLRIGGDNPLLSAYSISEERDFALFLNFKFKVLILLILEIGGTAFNISHFNLQNREEWDGLGMWRVWVRRGTCIGSWWGNRKEGEHWGDLGVDGWITLGWISRSWDVGICTVIGLAQDRDRWRTFVSAVMNLRVRWNAGNFLTSCKPVSFSRSTLHHRVSK